MNPLHDLIASNPLLAGGATMAVAGWAVMQLKNAPQQVWGLLRRVFTTTVTIHNDEYVFSLVERFLAQHEGTKRTRNYSTTFTEDEEGRSVACMTPGDGHHLIRHKRRLLFINKTTKDSNLKSGPDMIIRKSLTLTILGRSRTPLDDFLADVQKTRLSPDKITVKAWGGSFYDSSEYKRKRSMDTIYIQQDIKDSILRDIRWFMDKAAWYKERNIPHRRGYLLQGPPGTGKTSLITALASELDKSISIISLTSCETDNSFLNALNSAGPNIVAIEDVDSFMATHERKSQETSKEEKGVTLSGILNALDGIASKDGRVVIMTTNRPDVLDAALVRPGRIDRIFTLDHADREVAGQMFDRFGLPIDREEFLSSLELPMSQAALQNRLMAVMESLSE